MDRKYEVMFILRPDTSEEDLEKLLKTMESNVAATGGKVTGFDRALGKRRLAYTVKKFQEGIYILAFVEGTGVVLKELERRLRVQELVIKMRGQGTQGQAAAAAAAASAAATAAAQAEAAEAVPVAVAVPPATV